MQMEDENSVQWGTDTDENIVMDDGHAVQYPSVEYPSTEYPSAKLHVNSDDGGVFVDNFTIDSSVDEDRELEHYINTVKYEGSINIENTFDTLQEYNKHIERLRQLFDCAIYTDESGQKHLCELDFSVEQYD